MLLLPRADFWKAQRFIGRIKWFLVYISKIKRLCQKVLCRRSLGLVELFSGPHMTSFWPTVTQSPDCIATMSIQLQWQWRTGFRQTIAYLSLADIANLGAIRLSLISAHGTAVSILLPHGQIRHNINLGSTLGPNKVTLLALLCENSQHFFKWTITIPLGSKIGN